MRLAVVEGQALTSGIRTVVGSIPVGELRDRISTPWRDARSKEGYQRKPAMSRVAKLMMEIRKQRVDIPTAILLNASHSSWKNALSRSDGNGCQLFDLERYKGTFSVVDGQHRVLAFKELYSEDPERYSKIQLHFVMMLGAQDIEELEQFYIVNSTAKSVRTDLAFDLLKQRAESDPAVMRALVESGQEWKVRAQALTELLADNSEVWRRRIRLANEAKGITIIPSASFVTSLKTFLTHPFITNLHQDQQFEIIETYWQGIRLAIPQPFGEPDAYTLLKGIGVWAMHEVLPNVIEVIRSRGQSLFDADNYKKVIEGMLRNLEGQNQKAETVRGADFWLTAPKGGAAGSYSSSAGKRVLLSKMKQGLPKPEIQ
jgi:DGQHR domain-containing protein